MSETLLAGTIADDLAAALDRADALVRAGLATVLFTRPPPEPFVPPPDADAVVIVASGGEARGRALDLLRGAEPAHLLDLPEGWAGSDALSSASLMLADLLRSRGGARGVPGALPSTGGAAIIAGSQEAATLDQVEQFRARRPSLYIEPAELAGERTVAQVTDWAEARLPGGPVMVYSSAPSGDRKRSAGRLGEDRVTAIADAGLAAIAAGLVEAGVRRLVVAGVTTAEAVLEALGLETLRVGPEIVPGLRWTLGGTAPALAVAVKPDEFGPADLFSRIFAGT